MKLFQLHDVEPVEFEAMRAMIGTEFCSMEDAFIAVTRNDNREVICVTNDPSLAQTHVDSGKEFSVIELDFRINLRWSTGLGAPLVFVISISLLLFHFFLHFNLLFQKYFHQLLYNFVSNLSILFFHFLLSHFLLTLQNFFIYFYL